MLQTEPIVKTLLKGVSFGNLKAPLLLGGCVLTVVTQAGLGLALTQQTQHSLILLCMV